MASSARLFVRAVELLAGGGERDPGGAERDLLRFAECEHVRVARRQQLSWTVKHTQPRSHATVSDV